MTDCGVLGLIFSKSPQKLEAFQSLSTGIVLHINWTVSSADGFNPIESKLVDEHDGAPAGRVFQFETTVGKELTLMECKAITDSERIRLLQTQNDVEVVLQPKALYLRHRTPGLAVFDMDSTLIQQEVIDELARAVGLYDQVAEITAKAMRGEEPYTDFSVSLRARVKLLKDVPSSIWEELRRGVISFTPGAPELLRALRRLGWKTAVLSGGFTPLAAWLQETLGMDYAFANHLVEDPETGKLTGELVANFPIIDGMKKRELLLQLAAQNGIPPENVVAVGDGANDLFMMGVAGLGIAIHAKPKVQIVAPMRLNCGSLVDVLYVLGFNGEEVRELTKE